MNIKELREEFIKKYKNNDFVIDKTGVKMLELTGITLLANEDSIIGTPNQDYIKKELEWYLSESLNVYDIPKTPKIWRQVCDKNGFINSNYGWCIFSKENFEQYKNCLRALRADKFTRRAMMIYTRPSMQYDYNKNGMSDWICTNLVMTFIRYNKLIYIVNQRSCDSRYGFLNDLAWHKFVSNKLLNDLKEDYPEVTDIEINFQFGSIHIYERDFKYIEELICQK